ncbi:MAG: hypothetical protein K0Q79_1822 [Flavipsychrobacter sp.]|jgi:hypothetical protein|nr:hypothetical protein [Flavipsychrobacter sp.]
MEFVYLPQFVKKLKAIVKKYPSFKKDFELLLPQIEKYPQLGKPLGKDCYKIRIAIKGKNQGKSGGARIITCVKIQRNSIYFLTIYDKSEQETVSDKDLSILIQSIERN